MLRDTCSSLSVSCCDKYNSYNTTNCSIITHTEEFIFNKISREATALIIAISAKAPSQYKKDAERVGYVVVSLEKLNKQTIHYHAKNKKQQHSDEEASAKTTTVESTSSAVKNDMFGSPSGDKSRVTISEMYPVLDDKWQPLTLSMGGKYKDCHAPAMMLISTSISVENDS